MTIQIFVRPGNLFEEEPWTELTLIGEHEERIASVVIATLLQTRHEVAQLGEDGELEPYEGEIE